MKESVTKFDLESAFKALDEIDFPSAEKGIRANRPALTEIFSHKSKFDSLFEEYYDINSTEGLDDAKAAREAEVAKAKLERIEKIVDLDADSPEDLLTSYVGKYIMQCPQCMTLFYKDKEDIVESEEDPNTVNVNEVCQHCGNESGYTLVGKVGEAEAEASAELEIPEEENLDLDIPEEEPTEETPEESAEDLEIDLDAINLEDEPVEEEKTEEAFVAHTGELLVEDIQDDKELDAKLEAHNEYIEYLRAAITQEEEALEKATNEQVKVAIQRNIDAFKADLEAALPDAVKNDEAIVEEPVEATADEMPAEEAPVEETFAEAEDITETEEVVESLTESLHEEAELEVSADEFEELIDSPEFKKPISDTAVRAMIDAEKEAEEEPIKESKSLYVCTDCGYEIELEDEEYDSMCPHCKEHRGNFEKCEDENSEELSEGILDNLKLTRAGKAEWILSNALIDYEKAVIDKNGNVEADESNRKFNTFVIISYQGVDVNNKKIERAPSKEEQNKLVPGTKYPDVKTKYKDAENIAKGWSMKSEGGPAVIYLAKGADDDKAIFLCQYFDGKLDPATDNLDAIINEIKRDQKGSELRVKGGTDQSDVRKVKADAVKPGMKIQLKDKTAAEVTAIKKISDPEGGEMYRVTVLNAEGKKVNLDRATTYEFAVMRDSIANESLATIMQGVEELQEAVLESLISESLVEAYGNVAGYRLTNCSYLGESLTVDGTIYFTSGNTRKTTYTFNESCVASDGKISLRGLNEKLGVDKQFTLIGRIDNKTLITESFKRNK